MSRNFPKMIVVKSVPNHSKTHRFEFVLKTKQTQHKISTKRENISPPADCGVTGTDVAEMQEPPTLGILDSDLGHGNVCSPAEVTLR